MIDHSNDCEIPGTGYCSCHGNRAALLYAKAERDTACEQVRYWRRTCYITNGVLDSLCSTGYRPGLGVVVMGRLLCRLGLHHYNHAGFYAWNMYRISCIRDCNKSKGIWF